jgi:hypothetical protein
MHLGPDQLSMVCEYCGNGSTPPGDDDGVRVAETTSHHCPVCATALANSLIQSLEMLYCTGAMECLSRWGVWCRCSRFCASTTTTPGIQSRLAASTLTGSSIARCARKKWIGLRMAQGKSIRAGRAW